jgi:hypothetical protein
MVEMEKLKVAKVVEIPAVPEPDTIYIEKAEGEETFKIVVTSQTGELIEMKDSKSYWNDGHDPAW